MIDDAVCPIATCGWRATHPDITVPVNRDGGGSLTLALAVQDYMRSAASVHAESHQPDEYLAELSARAADLEMLAKRVRSGSGLTLFKSASRGHEDELAAI